MPFGPRIRANNVYGIISDNPLAPASPTFNSVSLPLLPVVAAAHAIIVFDPKRVFGDPEIVVVTVHTAASTVATILRGQYGTSQREHPQGTAWAHVPVDEDWTEILTSSSRPIDPYWGQMIFETDTDSYVSRSVSDAWQTAVALGAWTPYTPTWLQGVTVISKTVNRAVWTRSGRWITVAFKMTATGVGTLQNFLLVGLPVPAAFASDIAIGAGYFVDVSAVDAFFGVQALLHDTSTIKFLGTTSPEPTYFGGVGTDFSAAIAAGDIITATVTYEAAT